MAVQGSAAKGETHDRKPGQSLKARQRTQPPISFLTLPRWATCGALIKKQHPPLRLSDSFCNTLDSTPIKQLTNPQNSCKNS